MLYQISCYISSQKTIQNKGNYLIGTGENSLLYQIFCYIRSLYIEFPLYNELISPVPNEIISFVLYCLLTTDFLYFLSDITNIISQSE